MGDGGATPPHNLDSGRLLDGLQVTPLERPEAIEETVRQAEHPYFRSGVGMTSGRERTVSVGVSIGARSGNGRVRLHRSRRPLFRGGLGMVDLRFSRKFTTLLGKIVTEPRKSSSELDRHVWHGRT